LQESLTSLEEEEDEEEVIPVDSLEPRPGTTKRRQYYYKRVSITDLETSPCKYSI
jgi:hypothetical protein